jgi:hypothetical protein
VELGAQRCSSLLGGWLGGRAANDQPGRQIDTAGGGGAVQRLKQQAGGDPALVGQRLVHRGQVGAGGARQVVEADDRQRLRDRQVPLVRRLEGALGEQVGGGQDRGELGRLLEQGRRPRLAGRPRVPDRAVLGGSSSCCALACPGGCCPPVSWARAAQ